MNPDRPHLAEQAVSMNDVTLILSEIEQGDPTAAKKLLPLVYDELRKLAVARMSRERPDHTLQPTALVHEAFIRLVDSDASRHWDTKRHFFAAAAESMRRILIERARKKNRREELRGPRVPLDELTDASSFPDAQLLLLNEALQTLEAKNPDAAKVVKLRFFAGLTMQQTADVLDVSLRTAERHWTYARTWLHRTLEQLSASG